MRPNIQARRGLLNPQMQLISALSAFYEALSPRGDKFRRRTVALILNGNLSSAGYAMDGCGE